ncbi:MAG TPA: helix-hairpin-helix domain-containing protein, partial [Stellaceae bacterium]|nr:helix-hairpin-helix domain-containing protein [Stellaceae bacterium]
RRLAETASTRELLDGVAAVFGLRGPLDRIEVYDNSHIQGAHAVGAMIVAGPEGLVKSAYRKFTIRGVIPESVKNPLPPLGEEERVRGEPATADREHDPLTPPSGLAPTDRRSIARGLSHKGEREEKEEDREIGGGDDYAMMREVLLRRFARAGKEASERDRTAWPDLVLLDGGRGQLNTALSVFAERGVTDVAVAAIAKGPDRNAGRERFFLPGREPFSLDPKDPVLYFLQRLRDEAHRFAIGTHRARRAKALGRSPLDEVAGIGPRRKQALLHHFGSARAVARASLGELERVPGISRTVAKKVYDHFRAGG